LCVIEHTDIVPQLLQARLCENIRQTLQELPGGKAGETFLDVTALTAHRIQSPQGALKLLSKELASAQTPKRDTLPEIDVIEKEIFSQVEKEEVKQSRSR